MVEEILGTAEGVYLKRKGSHIGKERGTQPKVQTDLDEKRRFSWRQLYKVTASLENGGRKRKFNRWRKAELSNLITFHMAQRKG